MSIITTRKTVVLSLLFSCIAFSSVANAAPSLSEFQQLSESTQRSDENIQRNQYRHPAQTLQFFGLEPQMSVLEIWPGHGWYTEILAPFLKAQGKLTLAQFRHNDGSLKDERSIFWARVSERLAQRIADNAEYFGTPDMIELDPPLFYPQQNDFMLACAVASPLLLLIAALSQRKPKGYAPWRKVWRLALPLMLLVAIADLVLTILDLPPQVMLDAPWRIVTPVLLSVSVLWLLRSRTLRLVFAEWPEPVTASKQD